MSRTPSHEYRETLDAKSRDLEDGSKIINQYKITDTIGRGAYGTVRKAILTDDPSVKFAVKEFGKTRLRKTHRAVNFRKPGRGRPPRPRNEFNGNDAGNHSDPIKGGQGAGKEDQDELKDPLTLIRHEIAILKKLHHPHVVKLYEVLDDPSKDSLYMVFEYCPDGTVIDIRLNESVEPLPEDVARLYFVQVLMGIEYLHENEIVHRDIKPDNILLSDDRKTCKIVDFGVSEMFLKPGDDTMQKSAGSPAFMSPELCTAGHQEYHGKSDDIWSFGVTLYCMVVGHLPFNKDNFYEMYESIKNDEPDYPDHLSDDLKDLLQKMLIKDPAKRITVPDMRKHPWTLAVEDGILLSKEENLEAVVSEITDDDLDCAICKITNIFTFARAISRFKKGGSMQRARREASRSTSGGSNHDGSWFPPSTPSPDKPSRSNTKDSGTDDASQSLAREVATIKEETPTPAAQDADSGAKPKGEGEPGTDQGAEEQVRGLQKAAAYMFESPQMHTFELPPEEPDGNGPLQRNRSGPISTLHKPEPVQDGNGPPIVTMDSPRSASPEMFASPTSESGASPFAISDEPLELDPKDTQHSSLEPDTSKPDDAIASQLSGMMLKHGTEHHSGASSGGGARHKYESPHEQRRDEVRLDSKDGDGSRSRVQQRAKTVEERAASLGKKKAKPKPKLLPDQPTYASPRTETIQTPPGAADVYLQCGRSDDEKSGNSGKAQDAKDYNPYFATRDESQQEEGEQRSEGKSMPEADKQAATV